MAWEGVKFLVCLGNVEMGQKNWVEMVKKKLLLYLDMVKARFIIWEMCDMGGCQEICVFWKRVGIKKKGNGLCIWTWVRRDLILYCIGNVCVTWLSDDMGVSQGVCVIRKCVKNKDMGGAKFKKNVIWAAILIILFRKCVIWLNDMGRNQNLLCT